jgi:hypothetical protein
VPFSAITALAAPVIGAGVSSLLSPGTTGGNSSLFIPQGLSTADQQLQQLLTGDFNDINANSGQFQALGNQSLNAGLAASQNFAPNLQNAANVSGVQNTALGSELTGLSGIDANAANTLTAAGFNTYENASGANPAQYNQSLNNLTQQTAATNSMFGLGSSGAGAGVQNQALSNFNIDWNTQQIQNQIAGLGAMSGADAEAGSLGGQAGALGAAGSAATLAGGTTPFNVAQSIAGVPGTLANTAASSLSNNVLSPAQSLGSSDLSLISQGTGVQTTAFNAGNQAAGAAGALTSSALSGLSGLGSGSQSLSSLFGLGSSGSSGNLTSPFFSGSNSFGFTS